MATASGNSTDYAARAPAEQDDNVVAAATIVFAAIMMMMIGTFQALEGLAALLQGSFFVAMPNYLYSVSTTTWGWTHLILGILVAAAGAYLLSGKLWARMIGIVLVVLSAIDHFAFVPYYPLWSILIILLDVIVIWALAVHGRALNAFNSN